jgi:uncharacterized lipoprotein YmbA
MMRGYARVLGLLVGVCLTIITGCTTSPPARLYVLTPVAAKDPVRPSGGQPITVGIRRVTLPEYLSRPQIVNRVSATKLDVAEFDLWAAPLSEAVTGVLAENLAVMIPTERVAVFPWLRTGGNDYEIAVDVVRFEGRLGGTCDLIARWSLFDRTAREPLVTRRSNLSEPAGGTYEALAAAHSRLLIALSRDIAAALEQVAGGGSRAAGR